MDPTEEYGGIKLMTWKDQDFDLLKVQSVLNLHHFYFDGLSTKRDELLLDVARP